MDVRKDAVEPNDGDDFALAEFQVRPRERLLVGADGQLQLDPKVLAVLLCLARQAPRAVSREELMQDVWGETAVSDDALTFCIGQLRKAFGDNRRAPRFIETLHKTGYRLLVTPRQLMPTDDDAPEPATATDASHRVSTSPPLTPPVQVDVHKRTRWPLLLVLALLLVAAAWWGWRRADDTAPHSYAVLPIRAVDDSVTSRELAAALTVELRHELARHRHLTIISEWSSQQAAASQPAPRAIAKQLEVDAVLVAELLQNSGETVVVINAIDGEDGRALWSERIALRDAGLLSLRQHLSAVIAPHLPIAADDDERGMVSRHDGAQWAFVAARRALSEVTLPQLLAAEKALQQALQLDPDFHWARAYQIICLANLISSDPARRGQWRAQADASIHLLREHAVGSSALLLAEAALAFHLNDYDTSERQLKQLLRRRPNLVDGWEMLATVYIRQSRFDAARDALFAARERDPLSVNIHHKLGYVWKALGDVAASRASYQRTLELDDDNAIAIWRLAWTDARFGRVEDAARGFRRAWDLGVRHPLLYSNIIEFLIEQGQLDGAARWLSNVESNAVDEPIIYCVSIQLALAQNDTTLALQRIDRALARTTESRRFHWWQVVAHWQRGDHDAALHSLAQLDDIANNEQMLDWWWYGRLPPLLIRAHLQQHADEHAAAGQSLQQLEQWLHQHGANAAGLPAHDYWLATVHHLQQRDNAKQELRQAIARGISTAGTNRLNPIWRAELATVTPKGAGDELAQLIAMADSI